MVDLVYKWCCIIIQKSTDNSEKNAELGLFYDYLHLFALYFGIYELSSQGLYWESPRAMFRTYLYLEICLK